tara:strand:- start:391 stop:1023 length:633 start_codon:yes stop_codon:yes gene_type:complete
MSFKIILFLIFFFSSSALAIKDEAKKTGAKVTMEEVQEFLAGFGSKKKISSGTLIFQNGTKYIGSFKQDMIHGSGKFIDLGGNAYQGKWKYGKLIIKVDRKTRQVIKINRLTGASIYFETRGKGSLSNNWFESEPKIVNVKEVNKISELNFFNQPSAIYSSIYSDEKKIKKILEAENLKTSSDPKNMKVKYQLTPKGKKDMRIAIIKQRF